MSTAQAVDVRGTPAEASPGAGVGEVRKTGWFVRITIVVVVLLWLIPTIGVLISSLRPPELVESTGWWTVFGHLFDKAQWTFQNYRTALSQGGFSSAFLNSLAVTTPAP